MSAVFTGIFFVEDNQSFEGELKHICLRHKINVEYEIDFEKLLSKTIAYRPEFMIINLKDYRISSKYLHIFKEGSPFYVPVVLVVGNIHPDFGMNMPCNYYYVKMEDLEEYLVKFVDKLSKINKKPKFLQNVKTDYKEQIYKALMDMGLNASTNGTTFLKECINEIMLNNCKPSVFNSSLYSKVAFNYKTSPACVARCMKVAVDTAWKKRDSIPVTEDMIVTFKDFVHCPTAKEFVYFVANKLYNYNQEERIKKLAMQNAD